MRLAEAAKRGEEAYFWRLVPKNLVVEKPFGYLSDSFGAKILGTLEGLARETGPGVPGPVCSVCEA